MSTIEQWNRDLLSSDVSAQALAAESLASLGEEAQPAITALVRACGSSDEDVCNWSNAALEQVGPPAPNQIDELVELAGASQADVAFWAITLLGRAKATVAVPILRERLQDDSAPQVRQRAEWALKRIEAT